MNTGMYQGGAKSDDDTLPAVGVLAGQGTHLGMPFAALLSCRSEVVHAGTVMAKQGCRLEAVKADFSKGSELSNAGSSCRDSAAADAVAGLVNSSTLLDN